MCYGDGGELVLDQHSHGLGEEVVDDGREPVLAEEVDGVEVRDLHPAQPHEVNVALQEFLHLTPRPLILEVGIKHDLDEHTGMIAAGPTAFITVLDPNDVEIVNDGVQDADKKDRDD